MQAADHEKSDRIAFIKHMFAQYYRDNYGRIVPPPDLQQREFAFFPFGEKFVTRHRAVKSMDELVHNIQTLNPSDVYHSTAYYMKPAEEMEKKGWLGSDLVFDIDADHIPTPCKIKHDTWKCTGCGKAGPGKKPEQCPECGKTKFEERTWLCDECLNVAKNEVFKLYEFLTVDFGIPFEEIRTVFSGHRGYHLHIRTAEVRKLDESQRKEIVDYVMGTGLDPRWQGLHKERRGTIVGPQPSDPGWRGRLAKEIHRLITEGTENELTELDLGRRLVQKILLEREEIRERWKNEILWGEFEDAFRIKEEKWQAIIEKALQKGALSAEIDTVVTTDIHRLIRLAETLNGKTGLRAMAVQNLKEFDPFTTPVAFTGETTLRIANAPSFRIGATKYGPYTTEETVTLPTPAALLLLCKGMGNVKSQQATHS